MNLPLRAWKEVLATLGMSAKKVRPKPKKRGSHPRQLESLEDRRMMTTLHFSRRNRGLNTTSLNWSNAASDVGVTNGDTAVFDGTAATVTIAASTAISAAEIDFATTGYTIATGTGGTLAITGSGKIDVASGLCDAISAPLNGSNGLTKTSDGTLILSGTNTYTGGTVIDAGMLSINADAALGTEPGNPTTNIGLPEIARQ